MTVQTIIIEKFDGKDGQFYWRLRNTNGKTASPSEGYTRRWTRDRIAKRLAKLTGWEIREAS